jgi:hypothetical protein
MRKFWRLLVNHLRQDFHAGYYAAVLLFLAAAVFGNYWFAFENRVLDSFSGRWTHVGAQWVFYATGFGVPLLLLFRLHPARPAKPGAKFWWLAAAGLFILAFKTGFPYLSDMTRLLVSEPGAFVWAYKVCNNVNGFITTLLPLALLHAASRAHSGLYGLGLRNFDARPYGWLLLLIPPLVAIASFEPGFQRYYPLYRPTAAAALYGWPEWLPAAIYELVYGLDFINVELLFRGFFVIGLSSYLGRSSVLLMTCIYCFLHFGKPAGECIASVFGGYLLGVIAYETRNIWGGILLHIALAWGMELAAFLQKIHLNTP